MTNRDFLVRFITDCVIKTDESVTVFEIPNKWLNQQRTSEKSKWVLVSERLPDEKYIRVLLTIKNYRGRLMVRSGDYYEDGSFHSDTGEFWHAERDKELIAWQPLIEPYRGRKRK